MSAPEVKTEGSVTFDAMLADVSVELASTARALRSAIAAALPGVTEVPWPKQGTVGYGVGPKKMSEHFCYIGLHKGHVNLGFFYGADLKDPEGLLMGTGKALRHIKVRSVQEVDSKPLHALIRQASKHLPKLGG